jgi:hypothetical protein
MCGQIVAFKFAQAATFRVLTVSHVWQDVP